jgi:hypothetical protein
MSTIKDVTIKDGKIDPSSFFSYAGELVKQAYLTHHRRYYVVDITFHETPNVAVEYVLRSYPSQPDYIVERAKVLAKATEVERTIPMSVIGTPGHLSILLNSVYMDEVVASEIDIAL